MTKKASFPVATAAPIAIHIDGDAGGVGKSLLGVTIAQAFGLVDYALQIFELDDQAKLARFLGSTSVTALHGASASRDAYGEQDTALKFEPYHNALVGMANGSPSVLLEIGGSLTGLANDFVREVDLEEDLGALGLTLIVFLVVVASEESVRQVLAQLATLRRILPSAKPIIVLNERNGSPLSSDSQLPTDLVEQLESACGSVATIRMPKIREKSQRLYESLGQPPAVIASWHADYYAEATRRTGLRLFAAKRFVKDISAWSHVVNKELIRTLPFLGGKSDV
jgi:hypothetical protein